MVRDALVQHIFLYDTYMKYGTARRCRPKFHDERVLSRQTIHNLVNKLRSMVLSVDKKQKQMSSAYWGKVNDTGARLEHTPRKSLVHQVQETGVSKSSARRATQLLKFRSYKGTVIYISHAAARTRLNGSFLQLVSTVCHWKCDQSAIDILMKCGFTCRNT
jgi:hypothetical protein